MTAQLVLKRTILAKAVLTSRTTGSRADCEKRNATSGSVTTLSTVAILKRKRASTLSTRLWP